MNVKVIFNTNKELKASAMKKARAKGMTLSAVLNLATQAFVNDTIVIDVVGRDIAEARLQKSISGNNVYKKFGIPL